MKISKTYEIVSLVEESVKCNDDGSFILESEEIMNTEWG